MIKKLRAFGAFWYDFIIGDDWRVAVAVGLAFVVTHALSRSPGNPAWLVVSIAVLLVLPFSIYRVTRSEA